MSIEDQEIEPNAETDLAEFPPAIDLGEVVILHIDVVEEAPAPEIFIGLRRRPDPGPPTTRAMAEALARWRAEAEAKSAEGAEEKPGQTKRNADPMPPSSGGPA